jgi:hypothetical protein
MPGPPFEVQISLPPRPEVYASLRPPATVLQPSGLLIPYECDLSKGNETSTYSPPGCYNKTAGARSSRRRR